ncbi:MAG TPA: DUF4835 family protein [Tenuifilaceae bacterium]|nr:DUF4835 family protein [Tenuifilaceae bacterium]HPI46452.1 DUF4835 family protein [Tenuifilaceae bacterium]HPN22379.1 DUF4835 family protein [Tenuifilaceae bacterium]
MVFKRIIFIVLIVSPGFLWAQELRCNIQVNTQKIQGTNRTVFQTLQTSLYEFMNNTAWTNHVYGFDERIECNIMLNITEQLGSDEYKGTLQIQARRPVFNSSYNTTMLNFLDNNLHFRYREFDKIEFTETSHLSNLSSTLAFYAYIILGIDYDSYSNLGGSEYFLKAEKIVTNAQNAPERGWKAYEGNRKNRYWMVENLLNSKYRPLREVYYRYHRQGLDRMSEKPTEGRAEIAESLALLQKVYREKPDPYLFGLQLFFDAKNDELVNVFSESFPTEQARVVNILIEVDNPNASKYKTILEQKNE